MEEVKKEVIMVNGGLGREVALTGVITEYAKRNPDKEINVIAGFPELYYNNPHINRVYSIQHQYVFDDVIKDAVYIDLEPYNDYEYYHNNKHLIEVYAKQLIGKLEYIEPQLFLAEEELKMAKEYFTNKENFSKPIIFFQPFGSTGGKYTSKCNKNGGIECTDITQQEDPTHRSITYEMAEKIADELKEDYDLIMIRTPDQYPLTKLKGLFQPNGQPMPIRQIIAAIPYIKGFISCDSFLHHAAKAMECKNGIVFWGTTRPGNLGYDCFENVIPNKKFIWTPNRQPHNNPDVEKINKDLMKYTQAKEYMELIRKKLKEWCDENNTMVEEPIQQDSVQ